MKKKPEWYETFFGGLYSKALAGHDEAKTLQDARVIKKVLRLRKGQRVLDCPCGQGRIPSNWRRWDCESAVRI